MNATQLFRGDHPLPCQSQAIRRDLDGEQIARHPEARARAYRLTDEQIASGRWMYEWVVTAPDQPAMSWTAFHTAESLQAWLSAYDLTIDAMPERGETAIIVLPAGCQGWLPLTEVSDVGSRSKRTEFRVNCEGDTLAGRFIAATKSDAARGFAKALRVEDGNTIRVWTVEEYEAQSEPTTFWVEHVR